MEGATGTARSKLTGAVVRQPARDGLRTPMVAGQRGAAIIETVIALPILLAVILGAIQFGLIYEAKATLNHAALQAARAGAVGNAQTEAIRSGLARGLVPLYSPESSMQGFAATLARVSTGLATDARVRILNPTREAFEDFAEDVDGVREIPNDRLHARSTSAGAQSGMNIQDANLLRVEITYGYELKVPLVNWFISRLLLSTRRAGSMDAFELGLLRRMRLPIVTTSTVRMQSPVRMSDAMVARADLPDVERIAADARPPDDAEDGAPEGDQNDGSTQPDDDHGSSLADGFFGFGEGHSEGGGSAGSGNGGASGGAEGGGSTGSGGGNSGDPVSCSGEAEAPTPAVAAPASAGSSSGEAAVAGALPSLSVGNPIHVVTGNKYQKETDLASLPGELGLTFVRHYNSDATGHAGVLGAGWRHSYEASVRIDGDALDLWQADGRHLRFVRAGDTAFHAQRATDGKVIAVAQGWRWRWPSGRELEFDREGRLVAIREHARTVTLDYDATGRLLRVTDPQRRELTFDYFPNGRVAGIRGPGNHWRYGYDDAGNLAQVISAGGHARRYEYADTRHPNHLTAIRAGVMKLADYGRVPQLALIASWAYDEQGRGIYSSHPAAAGKVTLRYGAGYTDVTDAFGKVTRYTSEMHDGIAIVTRVDGHGCSSCGRGEAHYAFNDAFELTQVERQNQPSLRSNYDGQQRLQSIERRVNGNYEVIARYSYAGDAASPSRIEYPSIKPGESRILEFDYREDGQLNWMRDRGFTPLADGSYGSIERRIRFGYDRVGRLATVDGARTDVDDITHLDYDPQGRLVAISTAEGDRYRIEKFDAAGRPQQTSRTGHAATRYEYDALGHLTARVELHSRGERRTSYGYDALGRIETITDAQGRTQRIGYDSAGRPDRFSMDDAGIATALKYAPDGNVEAAAILNRAGQMIRGLRYAYDDQRRLREIRDGDGPPLRQIEYPDAGRSPQQIVDAMGNRTGFSYDAAGFVESMLAADGGITHYERDAERRLRTVTAPNDASTHYDYDDFGRLIEERSADRGITRYAYDAAGNLIAKTDARGIELGYDYDADNRLVRVKRPEGVTRFNYRNARLVEIVEPASSESFSYDDDGQLVRHIRRISGHRFTTAYRYDAQGRVERRDLPSGVRLRYRYGADGSLQSIARESFIGSRLVAGVDQSPSARSLVDPENDLRYGNGLEVRNRYDPATGRLESRSIPGVAGFSYQYDENGRIVELAEDARASSFRYDARGRLQTASTSLGYFRYRYDTAGNRIAESEVSDPARRRGRWTRPPEQSIAYMASANRMSGDGVGHALDYDPAGNVVQHGARRYEYDSNGRPIRLFVDAKLTAAYEYNASGERISKTLYGDAGRQRTFYLYERHVLIAEADAGGNITAEYVYAGAHPIALLRGASTLWIHTDRLGTPRAVSDADRKIVWRAAYEPFGAARVEEDPDRDGIRVQLNLRFPGQYADAESGTYYNLMRDYDPQTGRYLTPDPLGLYDGTNPFVYVHNNPISSIDRLGLYDEMVHYYMTYFLALVAGLPQDVARTMAIATQYVDENEQTEPLHGVKPNEQALPLYHFVMNYASGYSGDLSQDPLTRMQSPTSYQLGNLFNSTNAKRLQELWIQSHLTGIPGQCPFPSAFDINNARYQLYGEYLHAYEDTFAHRDAYNMPYPVRSNLYNTPVAWMGHGGPDVPDLFGHAPDHTYNQNYRSPSRCTVLAGKGVINIPGLTKEECDQRSGVGYVPADDSEPTICVIRYFLGNEDIEENLTRSRCNARSSDPGVAFAIFHPGTGKVWAYNELRTLRMEYEVFNKITSEFGDEIARNLEAGGHSFTWQDIAGLAKWDESNPEKNARIGNEDSIEDWAYKNGFSKSDDNALRNPSIVLQRFNASHDDELARLEILNAWLRAQGLPMMEPWEDQLSVAAVNRAANIGWIPSGSFAGVLLPSDLQ